MPSCMGVSVAIVLCAFQRTVTADECVGRRVMVQCGLISAGQFGNDLDCQYLAKLYPPLVERIYAPDGTLSEHAVLIEGDQGAEQARGEDLGQQYVGRPVA